MAHAEKCPNCERLQKLLRLEENARKYYQDAFYAVADVIRALDTRFPGGDVDTANRVLIEQIVAQSRAARGLKIRSG